MTDNNLIPHHQRCLRIRQKPSAMSLAGRFARGPLLVITLVYFVTYIAPYMGYWSFGIANAIRNTTQIHRLFTPSTTNTSTTANAAPLPGVPSPAAHPPTVSRSQGARRMQDMLNPMLFFSVMVGLLLYTFAAMTRRKYLRFDEDGLIITDSPKVKSTDPAAIPWDCLKKVDIISDKRSAQNAKPRPDGTIDPHKYTVLFQFDDGSQVKIKRRDLEGCTEPGPFINAVKTWAPSASSAFTLPDNFTSTSQATYTQLWFKYYSTGSDRQRTAQLVAKETLQSNRYEILGQIGGGGQGTAYLAIDHQLAQGSTNEIVLKEYILPLHRGKMILEQSIEKLRQEADILERIDHPNIVKMLGEFEEDHRGYIVMEYVTGQSLKELVTQHGPLPEETVINLATQICEVLCYLHSMDPPIIHRDLTPDNLMLQDDGIIKLVDFNVAHQLESAATATVVGKHCYIPPEQFRGKPTPQSDIYAFGCTLHYLLTGCEPEPITRSHPKAINPSISEQLASIVANCTELDTNKRIASAEQVRYALTQLDEGQKLSTAEKIVLPNQ